MFHTALSEPVDARFTTLSQGLPLLTSRSFHAVLLLKGSTHLFGSTFGKIEIAAGNLVLIPPGLQIGVSAEGSVELMIARFHPEFLIDQIRWAMPSDRQDSQGSHARDGRGLSRSSDSSA